MWRLLHDIGGLIIGEGWEWLLLLLYGHVNERRFLADRGGSIAGKVLVVVCVFGEVVEDFDVDPRMAVVEMILEINAQGVVVRSILILQEAFQLHSRLIVWFKSLIQLIEEFV